MNDYWYVYKSFLVSGYWQSPLSCLWIRKGGDFGHWYPNFYNVFFLFDNKDVNIKKKQRDSFKNIKFEILLLIKLIVVILKYISITLLWLTGIFLFTYLTQRKIQIKLVFPLTMVKHRIGLVVCKYRLSIKKTLRIIIDTLSITELEIG